MALGAIAEEAVFTGDLSGNLESAGLPDWYSRIVIEGDLLGSMTVSESVPIEGAILVNGSVTGSITIEGDIHSRGRLFANANGIGGGSITGPVVITGEFDGNICGDNLSPDKPLPPNIQIGSWGPNARICGVANSCTASVTAAVTPTDSQEAVAKNRFISFVPGNSGVNAAIRVRLAEMPSGNPNGDFSAYDGQYRWVGPPGEFNEAAGPFKAAPLLCEPYYTDWGSVGTLHVYGADIVPGATYEVQLVHEDCGSSLAFETNYSTLWSITNQRWGDIVEPFGASQPNMGDVSAVLDGFRGVASGPIRARGKLQPNVPNPNIYPTFADVSAVLDALRGESYSFSGPEPCPSTVTCDPCTSNDDCPDKCNIYLERCEDDAHRCSP
jgi:hypothetical protein